MDSEQILRRFVRAKVDVRQTYAEARELLLVSTTWIRDWMLCLQANENYKLFCNLCETEQSESASDQFRKMQLTYSEIGSMYVDFGALEEVDFSHFSDSFEYWFSQRIGLFKIDDDVVSISHEQLDAMKISRGYEIIVVPIQQDKKRTLQNIEHHLDHVYDRRCRLQDYVDQKYKTIDVYSKKISGRVHRAISAHSIKRSSVSDEAMSQTDTVIAIMETENNPFDWKMTDQDKRDHERGTFKKSLFNGAKVKMLKKAEEDFAALVKNAIYGRFPDFS